MFEWTDDKKEIVEEYCSTPAVLLQCSQFELAWQLGCSMQQLQDYLQARENQERCKVSPAEHSRWRTQQTAGQVEAHESVPQSCGTSSVKAPAPTESVGKHVALFADGMQPHSSNSSTDRVAGAASHGGTDNKAAQACIDIEEEDKNGKDSIYTGEENSIYFNALKEHGKSFQKIHQQTRLQETKTCEQIRHYYYHVINRIDQVLIFVTFRVIHAEITRTQAISRFALPLYGMQACRVSMPELTFSLISTDHRTIEFEVGSDAGRQV